MLKDNGCTKKKTVKIEKTAKCKHCKNKFTVTDIEYFIEDGKVYYVCPKCREEFTLK